MLEIASFVVAGFLGGLASALLWAGSFEELWSYESFRAVVLGAIGGYLYYLMFTEWNVPNTVVAFFFGYAFKDIVEALASNVLGRILRGYKA